MESHITFNYGEFIVSYRKYNYGNNNNAVGSACLLDNYNILQFTIKGDASNLICMKTSFSCGSAVI